MEYHIHGVEQIDAMFFFRQNVRSDCGIKEVFGLFSGRIFIWKDMI
jgi:hypothetical protein